MYRVSKQYKEQIKNACRNHSYEIVNLGLINQEAQKGAYIGDSVTYTDYSNIEKIFDNSIDDYQYATFETNFTKARGTQYFIPRESDERYKNTLVSERFPAQSEEVIIRIDFKTIDPVAIKGISIDFDNNYPIDFTIQGESEGQYVITGNNTKDFETDYVFNDTRFLIISVSKMRYSYNRVRINRIRFGIGLDFTNVEIQRSELSNYGSAISDSIFQSDFSVTLNNRNQEFNLDNPKSSINFLEENQDMTIYFGYELENNIIEWVKTASLKVSSWESDDRTARIMGVDLLRGLDENYYKGKYYDEGITLYDLSSLVLEDARIENSNYYIDPYLKKVTVKNPLPNITHREALQIIANAGRCVLSVNRDGQIQLKSSFIPDTAVTCNGETNYSNAANIISEEIKQEYAEYTTNFSKVNGQQFFISKTLLSSINTGYISSGISDENGIFVVNPIITRELEASFKTYGLKLVFGSSLPAEFIIRTYLYNTLREEFIINSHISKDYIFNNDFEEFDKIELEFIKTEYPHSRVTLENFEFGDVTDFHLNYSDMLTTPKAIQLERVKILYVDRSIYNKSNLQEDLVDEDVEVIAGSNEMHYYFTDPIHGLSCELKSAKSGQNVEILDSGAYYVKINLKSINEDTVRLVIKGYKYNVTTQKISKKLNNRGVTRQWFNPLVDSYGHAVDILEWLGEYYQSNREYELQYRGNPEIDITDIIYQENKYEDNMRVVVEESKITNNGGVLSGTLKTRKRVK